MTIADFKCPRCRIPQKRTHQCAYCGLIFERFHQSARRKWMLLFAAVLIAAAALFAGYRVKRSDHGRTPVSTAGSPVAAPSNTTDDELMTTAKELSGDAGIVGQLTGGVSRGSVIAMVLFSIVGMGYFAYGKKSQQLLMLACGIALMAYPYFVDGTTYIVLIGCGLCVLPFIVGGK